ncbi:MAG: T9SS type A sorting domain-containing protein [Bacteroidales bacterium]|nr:T9SS type A sorting domain-containing protein [Bacteroidales bacterium]
MEGGDTYFGEDKSLGFAAISNRFKGLEKMKKLAILFLLMIPFRCIIAQEWNLHLEEISRGSIQDLVSVDDGEFALGIGTINYDGYVVKIAKDGEYIYRRIHLPGMKLVYYSAIELNSGNYMAFGICDDSLNSDLQRYLKVDVFNDQLEDISSRIYCVDDDIFDGFVNPIGSIMKSIFTRRGTSLLAVSLIENSRYGQASIRFYEFDNEGDIINIVDNPPDIAYGSNVEEICYEPYSDNLMVAVGGGNFPPNSGIPGIYVVDEELNIIAKQDFIHIQGGVSPNIDNISEITCEGKWLDNQYLLFDTEKYLHQRESFTYHTLYMLDSALNIHAELNLPPYDSCTSAPSGTNTAYINDSTIFAFTYCNNQMWSFNAFQTNVILVDNHLNLLGRKVIREDDVLYNPGPPLAFSDGGCLVPIYSQNGTYYQGNPFFKAELLKFRREDIEITWDVVNETETKPMGIAYPNPTTNTINIPIDETLSNEARIQIFDAKGTKCLDSEVGSTGNLITLDVHNLDAGLYVYKIVSGKRELASGKFVKE